MKLSSGIITNGIRRMKNLRILHVVSETDDDSDVKIHQVHQKDLKALRFLSWVGYPHQSLAKTFQGNNLVRLDMSESRIVRLWEGGERKV